MNTLDKQILDNTLALNHSLIQQNQIYEERIALLESKISSLTPSDTVLQEEDKDNPLSTFIVYLHSITIKIFSQFNIKKPMPFPTRAC